VSHDWNFETASAYVPVVVIDGKGFKRDGQKAGATVEAQDGGVNLEDRQENGRTRWVVRGTLTYQYDGCAILSALVLLSNQYPARNRESSIH
jgi:hypothetical protein